MLFNYIGGFVPFYCTYRIVQYDPGPVTIADREVEEAMVSVILKNFPTHATWDCFASV